MKRLLAATETLPITVRYSFTLQIRYVCVAFNLSKSERQLNGVKNSDEMFSERNFTFVTNLNQQLLHSVANSHQTRYESGTGWVRISLP